MLLLLGLIPLIGSIVVRMLGAIALVASYIPTSRVIRTDPMLALTHTA